MNNFEEIQSQWNKQRKIEVPREGLKFLKSEINKLKNNQKTTNWVLMATVVVLVGFFFYVSAHNNQTVTLGLSLMIGALIARLIIELLSILKLGKLNHGINADSFKKQLTAYYNTRRIVHVIITPILVALYALGFILLLPVFKATLSAGFYTYILVSSIILLLIFGFLIGKQLRNELKELKYLKDSD